MTQLQLSPEHPPSDTKADLDADEDPQLQQEELDRAAGEGMIAPPDEAVTQPDDRASSGMTRAELIDATRGR